MFRFLTLPSAVMLRSLVLGALLVGALSVNAETALPDASSAALLQRAYKDRTTNFTEFGELLQRLGARAETLSIQQRIYLRFLQGWKAGYEQDFVQANSLLQSVIVESNDVNLRLRAGLLMVNLLSTQGLYEKAFDLLSGLLGQLPLVKDPQTRLALMATAGELYKEAGQYELALNLVDDQLRESPGGDTTCIAMYERIATLYKSGKIEGIHSQFKAGVQSCQSANDKLYANGINLIIASLDVKQNKFDRAIALLQKNYSDVQRVAYPPLLSQFNTLLAQAYWNKGDAVRANKYALDSVTATGKNEFVESVAAAYKVLYLASRKSGDMTQALTYHEKYMAAAQGYLDEVSAKALAFQIVNQQVLAKKLQVDTLNKQNQILKLQHSLGTKALETGRLYIVLLLTILASLSFWGYRLKRSQVRFRKLARRDGLTGIFNRQHFVESAERQLAYCQKSARVAGFIVIDLDHFKVVNDTYGHAVGDHILRRAVAACNAHLRSTDVFGRLGGEEFGILMPDCSTDVVLRRADLIRMAIASVSDSEGALGVTVSASFGISSSTYSSYNLRQLLIHADKALYDAKRGGRNRVEVFAEVGAAEDEPSVMVPLQRR